LLGGAALQGCTADPAPFRIGVLADCEGYFRSLQESALTGAEIPFLERGSTLRGPSAVDGVTPATVAGRQVELVPGCIEGGEYSTVIARARLLVEVSHVDAVVGGTWPGDGLVLRDVARKYPDVTFIVSNSGDREVTLGDPAPNVFRFAADLSQQVAGLGTYAFEDLGWRHAVVVAEDDEAGWGGAAAFLAEFCALGGRASQFQMSPDLQPPSVPDADGVAVFFTPFGKTPEALAAFAGGRLPLESSLLLGPGAWNDLNSLTALPEDMKRVVTIVPATTAEASERYRATAARNFPDATRTDVMQPFVVQNNDGVEVVLAALEKAGGASGVALQAALSSLDVELASGRVRLDSNRAAVVSTALTRLGDVGTGPVIRMVGDVDQTLGGVLPATYQPGSGQQPCSSGPLPPWAR
jgi:branched-chain amino acid transport system substrate-binding protein